MAVLYVIPAPLGGPAPDALPGAAVGIVAGLRDFVVENPRTARAFLSALGHPVPLRQLRLERLDEHSRPQDLPALLAPLREGRSVGLIAEAGCPVVADPGAPLIELAHREGFRVVPLIGPSSLLLALMACGLQAQRFAFCGYLPRERAARARRIRELEMRSRLERETEVFIETPYRNQALFAALLEVCRADTRICVASELTLPQESIALHGVAEWRKRRPDLAGKPAVFLLQAV